MNLHKIQLVSKNNRKNFIYLYIPIVEQDGKYFWCESIKTNRPLKPYNIEPSQLTITREIPKEFYAANGIVK